VRLGHIPKHGISAVLPSNLLKKKRGGRQCTFCSSSAKSKAVQTLGKVGHQHELKRVAKHHETARLSNHISTINHLFLESISGSSIQHKCLVQDFRTLELPCYYNITCDKPWAEDPNLGIARIVDQFLHEVLAGLLVQVARHPLAAWCSENFLRTKSVTQYGFWSMM
jgi:hypothetical protein